ncbi:hypothetical protein B0H10DRAFT_552166 [Mycena sp. CBHHK59/15]|nr:hypothetical protein B0H10DRAFT_552166 [Mycena sp. CBHHK59/15]
MVASSSASASAQERSQWNGIIKLLRSLEQRSGEECFSWIRSLRAPSKALTLDPVPLAALTHLQELSIDLEAEGLATQHSILKHLLSPITNASHNLTLLALTSLPRIDIPLLRLIADCFPYLVDLYLSCTERLDFSCCWNCCGESLGLTIHSPVPDMFSDSTDMAVRGTLCGGLHMSTDCPRDAFADVLTPLTQLVHLHLGIYLSDEQLLDFHLLHDELLSEILSGPEECGICEKAAHHVRLRERAASLVFAQKLKALRTIAFSSFFVNNEICNREAKLQDRARNWPPTRETDTVCRRRIAGSECRGTLAICKWHGMMARSDTQYGWVCFLKPVYNS